MRSERSGWGVTATGLLLVAAGLFGMWFGWGIILNERGWSSFIAGAVALTGGVVTIALGRVISYLSRLAPVMEAADSSPSAESIAPPPPKLATGKRPDAPRQETPAAQPTEVDRYKNGDEVYVMLSDGTVEVSGPSGFRRYPSIAALRAEAEARKR